MASCTVLVIVRDVKLPLNKNVVHLPVTTDRRNILMYFTGLRKTDTFGRNIQMKEQRNKKMGVTFICNRYGYPKTQLAFLFSSLAAGTRFSYGIHWRRLLQTYY
jgi:hypothetical protein